MCNVRIRNILILTMQITPIDVSERNLCSCLKNLSNSERHKIKLKDFSKSQFLCSKLTILLCTLLKKKFYVIYIHTICVCTCRYTYTYS